MTNQEEIIYELKYLIYNIISEKYANITYPMEELVSAGNYGLIKAINTYKDNRNTKLSTYAYTCINNSIIDYIKKQKQKYKTISLNDDENYEIIENFSIIEKIDIENSIINQELYLKINNILNDLPELDKKILYLYFGFEERKEYTQKEIATILNVTQPYISRIINRNLKYIKNILLEENYICIKKMNYSRL